MTPLNPLDVGKFKKFALKELYAELYPMIANDFLHKQDYLRDYNALNVVGAASLVKIPHLDTVAQIRGTALKAAAAKGKAAIEVAKETGATKLIED